MTTKKSTDNTDSDRGMTDQKRELILKRSAYGFIACVIVLLFITFLFGKSYGRIFLVAVFPPYCLYYAFAYWYLCKGFKDETKRIVAFGITGQGSLTGSIFYLSICFTIGVVLFIGATLFNL